MGRRPSDPLLNAAFQPPPHWKLNPMQTLALSRKRYYAARKALLLLPSGGVRNAVRAIINHRLANPYMSDHVWKMMLGMVRKHQL